MTDVPKNDYKIRRTRRIHQLVALGVPPSHRIGKAIELVRAELQEAAKRFKPHASAHESYAVLLEEVDELKAEVWKNQHTRDYDAMATEAVQVAAMALRFLTDICFVHPTSRDGEAFQKMLSAVPHDAPKEPQKMPKVPKGVMFFSKRPLTKQEIAYGKRLHRERVSRRISRTRS